MHIELFEQISEIAKIKNGEETIKDELVGIIQDLPLQNLMSTEDLLNSIKENDVHIKLDDQ